MFFGGFVLTGHTHFKQHGRITTSLGAELSVAAPDRLGRISLNELF